MENIWAVTTFMLLFLLIIFIIYHIYYRINIKHITKELEEIMKIADTNELITLAAKQKDMTELVKVIIDILAMYYDDFNNMGVEPEVHLIEEPCMILGDEKGLRRIFSNN